MHESFFLNASLIFFQPRYSPNLIIIARKLDFHPLSYSAPGRHGKSRTGTKRSPRGNGTVQPAASEEAGAGLWALWALGTVSSRRPRRLLSMAESHVHGRRGLCTRVHLTADSAPCPCPCLTEDFPQPPDLPLQRSGQQR